MRIDEAEKLLRLIFDGLEEVRVEAYDGFEKYGGHARFETLDRAIGMIDNAAEQLAKVQDDTPAIV
jgi:hypothetical protein